ncbi:MAG: hypothetical protein MHPSP_001520, partial [Paramarteilia canceri]
MTDRSYLLGLIGTVLMIGAIFTENFAIQIFEKRGQFGGLGHALQADESFLQGKITMTTANENIPKEAVNTPQDGLKVINSASPQTSYNNKTFLLRPILEG